MRSQFKTAYTTNFFFYVFIGIATTIMGTTVNKFPLLMLIIFIAYFVGTTVAFAIAAKRTRKYTLYYLNLIKLLRLALWSSISSILKNVPCALEKNVLFSGVLCICLLSPVDL